MNTKREYIDVIAVWNETIFRFMLNHFLYEATAMVVSFETTMQMENI